MKAKWILAASLAFPTAAFAVDLSGAPGFQPEKYLGTWYQIESTNPFFQRACKCAKAEYDAIDARSIKVTNTCVKDNGSISTIEGKALILDESKPAQLQVKFFPISLGGVNYVVTEVGPNYEYAVVVSPGNSPIWILSRSKELPESVIAGIHLRLVQAGVRIGDLKSTDPMQCEF